MRGRRVAGPVLLAAVLLAGCASSPQADLNSALSEVTDRANAGDAVGLRLAVDRLIGVVDRQSGSDLPLDEAARIRADAEKVRVDADLLVPTPTPTPSVTQPPSPTPSATPSATPSQTPSASPTPSPTPSRTPSATPTPTVSTPPPTTAPPSSTVSPGAGAAGSSSSPSPAAAPA